MKDVELAADLDRLVVLHDSGQPEGGATMLAVASAIGARKAHIPVTYITAAGPISSELTSAGVDVIQIEGKSIAQNRRLQGAFEGIYRRNSCETIRRWIAVNDTPKTVYHLHNWSHFLSPSVFPALRPISSRLVLTLHDFFLSCPNGAHYSYTEEKTCSRIPNSLDCLAHNCDRRNYLDKLWRSARHQTRKILFDLARELPLVIVIHEGMIPSLLMGGIPESCIKVIRNPIKPFSASQIDIRANSEILFVGQLTHQKGPDLAVKAAQKAGLSIRLVGDGPMKKELMAIMPSSQFEGWRDRSEIRRLCENSRMLVMPSRWSEPFGLVAGEALWSGLPVIVSKNAFIAPEISRADAGVSCETGDVDQFSHAMIEIATNNETAVRMSDNAYFRTKELGHTIQEWEQLQICEYVGLVQTAPLNRGM